MIAPLRQPDPETVEIRQRLRQARRLVASTLLPDPSPTVRPHVSAWKAWLFAAWVLAATAAYAAAMLGWW